MKKSELFEKLKNIPDDSEIRFYVFDYEYNDECPYDIGVAKIVNIKKETLYLGVNKYE